MNSSIKTYSYSNGEIQRVQWVRGDSWQELEFFRPSPSESAFGCFCDIYRLYLVPGCPWIFGNMVLFCLPEDMELSLPMESSPYGSFAEPLSAAAALFRQGLKIAGGRPHFKNATVRKLYEKLRERGCLQIISGKLPVTTIIPVGNLAGNLTECDTSARLKVNSSFFIMDRFDCATVYDVVGRPFGLCVKDGQVTSPPLFDREALLINKDGTVTIRRPSLNQLKVCIGKYSFTHGENAVFYSRPHNLKLFKKGGKKLVIAGDKVIAASQNSLVYVPASGFVLYTEDDADIRPGDRVEYRGMEDITFGIQVGNSLLRNGTVTDKFISPFYNIRRLERVPFPPSLYPLDYKGARAARMALGADSEGKPMIVWAEGAPKLGYVPGRDSCGASLSEFGDICKDLGLENAVNIDGGGSAQILIDNKRSLMLSDRHEEDFSEAERAIPLGLIVR